MLRNLDSGEPIVVPFTTRLAMRDGDQNALVFDKVGDQCYLSEIHLRCAGRRGDRVQVSRSVGEADAGALAPRHGLLGAHG